MTLFKTLHKYYSKNIDNLNFILNRRSPPNPTMAVSPFIYATIVYMNKKPRISLFIVARNEEKNIARCIMSARNIVSEIIVVDAFSKDKTVSVCRELGALVFSRAFDGFINQKKYALSKTTGEWVLSLEPDEVLSPELAQEIEKAVLSEEYVGYELMRAHNFLGKRMYHGGLNASPVLRLARKQNARFASGVSHERLTVNGKVGHLKQIFTRHLYDNIDNYFDKFNRFSSLSARSLERKGGKAHLFLVAVCMPLIFLKHYVLQGGFLDGIRGFIWSVYSAFYLFTKHVKRWCLGKKKE